MKVFTVTMVALMAITTLGNTTGTVTTAKTEVRSRRSRAYTGGFVMRPAQGKAIKFANAQSLVPEKVLKSTAEEISRAIGLNIVVSNLDNADVNPAALRDEKTAAALLVRAAKDANATMLVAPEDAWAVLDVGRLAKDGASSDVLANRVSKELWRTTAIMLGASDSMFRPCLLEPVHSLSDLDALKAKMLCPEPFGNIKRNAKELGCGVPVFVTYRTACREGWAPSPTNELQKAIWRQTLEDKERGPTNPILIPPPSQKK